MSTTGAVATTMLLVLSGSAVAADLEIARGGVSGYRILTPAAPTPAESYAAQELQRILCEVSGATLPVVAEDADKGGPAFVVGRCARIADTGLPGRAHRLGEDGVLLRTRGHDVVLLGGGDRGQLYAVYELAERYLDCRFLADDCTVFPRRDPLVLPRLSRYYTPQFIYREELYADCAKWDFAARLRLNGANLPQLRGQPWSGGGERIPGFSICPFVHTTTGIVSADKYFAEHPEYFGLVQGQRKVGGVGSQLCFTNPEVLQICTQWVLDWLRDHPDVTCVDVSQNDAYPGSSGACECEACTAIVNEEGAQQAPILRFVNQIADKVAEQYPDKLVDTLAYDYTIRRPKTTVPRPNVPIRLCHYACYFHGIAGDALGENYRAAIDEWRPVTRNLFIWHYGTNFWHYMAPNPNLVSLANDIRYYAEHGVNGVMVQGDLQGTGGELCDLRHYLIAQLLWDPSRDPMEVRREFCEGYYGPCAGEVLEFLAAMDDWATHIERHIPTNGWHPPDVTPPEFIRKGHGILDRALAKAPDVVHRNRVEKVIVPLWYCELQWPEVYGLSKEDGRAMLAEFERVVRANDIPTMCEWGPASDVVLGRLHGVFDPAPEGAQAEGQ